MQNQLKFMQYRGIIIEDYVKIAPQKKGLYDNYKSTKIECQCYENFQMG